MDGWFYHPEDICRRTFCFLVVNLIADSPSVDEQVRKRFSKEKEMRMVYNSVSDTDKLEKRKSERSYQESNLRLSDYLFGCSTTELQETRGS